MKKNFKYKNGEINIIINEPIIIIDYDIEWYCENVFKKSSSFLDPFFIGLEMKVHRGGRICYGMLAAQVNPSAEQDSVKISIAYTNENTVKYEDSCLNNDMYVYKGLPKEYVEKVKTSILTTISEKENYPQCEISFEYAANCVVGSSPMLFGIIAEAIMNVIYTNAQNDIIDMDIESFTKQYIKNVNLIY